MSHKPTQPQTELRPSLLLLFCPTKQDEPTAGQTPRVDPMADAPLVMFDGGGMFPSEAHSRTRASVEVKARNSESEIVAEHPRRYPAFYEWSTAQQHPSEYLPVTYISIYLCGE